MQGQWCGDIVGPVQGGGADLPSYLVLRVAHRYRLGRAVLVLVLRYRTESYSSSETQPAMIHKTSKTNKRPNV